MALKVKARGWNNTSRKAARARLTLDALQVRLQW
jgi:hypothetical protein